MKKHLIIVRHASAEDIGNLTVVRDFERELVSRGIMEAAKLGNILKESDCTYNAIYSSGATRALQTATYIAEQIKFDTEKISIQESLYGSGPRGYLDVMNHIPASVQTAIMVGHNPDISYFVDYLTQDDTQGAMNNATAIHLSFSDLEWNEISQKSGKFIRRIEVQNH